MSTYESGYCGIDEYQAGEARRVMAEDLCVEGLYVVLFRIDAGEGREAVKYPSRITNIQQSEFGKHIVKFNTLNDDLQPTFDTHGTFIGGYWHKADAHGLQVGEAQVKTGYFKETDREDNMERELQAMLKKSTALVLHNFEQRELVTI